MKLLEYNIACKSCLTSDGETHVLTVEKPEKKLYENRYFKSEYQLSLFVQNSLDEAGIICQNCGSNNFHISDISIAGKKVLPGDSATQFQLVIIKDENGKVELKTGGSRYLPTGFLREAFDIIEDIIEKTPSYEFENKNWGNTRFVVATGYIGNSDVRTNRLEQFNFVGFDKKALMELVQYAKQQMIN